MKIGTPLQPGDLLQPVVDYDPFPDEELDWEFTQNLGIVTLVERRESPGMIPCDAGHFWIGPFWIVVSKHGPTRVSEDFLEVWFSHLEDSVA